MTKEFYPMTETDLRVSLVHKDGFQKKQTAPYIQVFPGNESYQESISMLDAIFCEGPMARKLIL